MAKRKAPESPTDKLLCTKCGSQPCLVDAILGVSPYCEDCQTSLSIKHTNVPEMTSEQIKEARLMYHTDIEQPHRKGELNKAWLESKYGGVKRARNMGFSDQEIKAAKYVYSGDDSYYKKS